jgi:secreted trypsin-like serine protease
MHQPSTETIQDQTSYISYISILGSLMLIKFLCASASFGIGPVLKLVNLDIITNSECADYYGSSTINANKLCVDTKMAEPSSPAACNGDSIGPLVITEADGLPTEVGIVSFGSSVGCESGAPATFASVTEYQALSSHSHFYCSNKVMKINKH